MKIGFNLKILLIFLFSIFLITVSAEEKNGDVSLQDIRENSQEVIKNIKEKKMDYIEKQQCFISHWNRIIKNFTQEHLKIFASCITADSEKEINWDYPDIPSTEELSVIYVYEEKLIEKIKSDLKKRKLTYFFSRLAYYKEDFPKYKKGEFYYY
ncbi:MAG: hypothetical protein Q4D53_08450 [Leptotrichiaceae bacterium]|nr:hypothetical protein [Leptotrichiaceae bacterium]